jgi:Sensors of blue-light using FAD
VTEQLHIVYVSQLAPGHDHSVFGSVCRTARQRNAESGVAGVLLFDGLRFCQWLHGGRDAVTQLMASIAADVRHTDVSVWLQALLPAQDFAPQWRAGFVEHEALDGFTALQGAATPTLLEGLAALLAQADLEPVLPIPARGLTLDSRVPGTAG